MSIRKHRWKAVMTVAVAVACAVSVSGTPAGATAPPDTANSATAAAAAPTALAALAPPKSGPSWTVTLITGDVVRLSGTPGHQSLDVVKDVPPVGDVSVMQIDGDMHAIPGVAEPMLARDQVDSRLFNVSLLAREGYADAGDATIPVIVSYRSKPAATKLRRGATIGAATVTRPLDSIQGAAVDVPTANAAGFLDTLTDPVTAPAGRSAIAAPLTAKPDVAKIWLDGRVKASLDVSRILVGADRAAAAGFDGTGATVAVLDTGIDETHPDLAGAVVDKQSFVEGTDPQDVTDRHGHGTHVASIIAGRGTASNGLYTGIAPGAKLVVGKVLGDNGSGTESGVIAGMEWAATKSKVVSMSLGSDPTDGTDPESQALNRISHDTGALFVVAAGNDSNPLTVNSPAAADAALAVGATAKTNGGTDGTSFSSKGPRLTDWAIKPEISAPGLSIRAAQAAGTNLGEGDPAGAPYADKYTNASGTSMATPHVAGAAAILVQRHPDWSAQQLRDALTSTARTGADETRPMTIWQYGAGVVDAGRAVTQNVYGTGIINLGTKPFPQLPGDKMSGTVTYTNTGDTPVTLDLTSRWWTAPPNFTAVDPNADWKPPAGAVTVEPSQVTVPAGGTATTTVAVDVAQAPFGATYGRLTASGVDGTRVGTTFSFVRDIERYRLSLPATDRDGTPTNTTVFSSGRLQNLDTGDLYTVTWDQGKSVIQDVPSNRLPKGRYSFIGWNGEFGEPPWSPLRSYTVLAEPEIQLDQDREYVLDARKAGLVDVQTEQPSYVWDEKSLFARLTPRRNLIAWPGGTPRSSEVVYMLASQTKATTGTFSFYRVQTQLAPPIAITAAGRTMPVEYPKTRSGSACGTPSTVPDCVPRFPAKAGGELVDIGAGTPAEVEQAAVREGGLAGRYVLLRSAAEDVDTGQVGRDAEIYIDEVAGRLGAAKVAGVVFAPPADGVKLRYNKQIIGPPIAVLSVQEGRAVTAALRQGRVPFGLRATFPSPYQYNVGILRDGALTNGVVYRPRDKELGQVDTRYHGDNASDWYAVRAIGIPSQWLSGLPGSDLPSELVPGRFSRTEYFSPSFPWQVITAGSYARGKQMDQRYNVTFRPGQRERHDIGAGPWVPGEYVGTLVPTATRQFMPVRYDDTSQTYSLAARIGLFDGSGRSSNDELQSTTSAYTGDLRCESGCGELLSHGANRIDTVLTNSDSPVFKLVNDTQLGGSNPGWTPQLPLLSTRTHTEWTVHAELDRTQPREQPGVLLDWSVDSGLDNVVSRGNHAVTLTPGYSSKYQGGDHGAFTVELWATYDDGATWSKVGTQSKVGRDGQATFHVNTSSQSNGYVGYRAVATDQAGNQIDQTVIRAARTVPASS
jgi:subtilisin family serine protease